MKNLLSTGFSLLLGLTLVSGCSGGGLSSQSPPPIAVTIQESVSAMDMGQSDALTATVSDDPHNGGVKWTVTCPLSDCGAMAKAASASGAADRYNAPSIVNTAETVTVTATSVSNPTKGAAVQVIVYPPPVITSGNPGNGTVGSKYGGHICSISGPTHGVFLYNAGGVGPYTWSWAGAAGSSVPPGLGVIYACVLRSPAISGIPTAAGTYNVIVTVTDSASPPEQASANYSITILP